MAGNQNTEGVALYRVRKLSLPGLDEIRESPQVIQVLLIPHLVIKDDQFPFDLAAPGQLSIQPLLDLNDLDLLDGRGIFLQLLRDLLDHLNLLLDLQRDGEYVLCLPWAYPCRACSWRSEDALRACC